MKNKIRLAISDINDLKLRLRSLRKQDLDKDLTSSIVFLTSSKDCLENYLKKPEDK